MDSVLQKIRSGFVRVLPHEFRTPLSTIIGGTKYIIDSFDQLSKPEILELLKMVHGSTNTLNRLLEKILLFAKLELLSDDDESLEQLGRKMVENVGDIIADLALDAAHKQTRMKDIELNITRENINVAITSSYLTTLIGELMDNAMKFSENGTPITVTVARDGAHCKITMRDEGRGMTPSQIRAIGAFTQFDRELYEQQGIGLGFSIIARIVDVFKGQLTINSEPAKGTTIIVLLPIASSKQKQVSRKTDRELEAEI
jgi:K+-sensing histidine kinase KdpD